MDNQTNNPENTAPKPTRIRAKLVCEHVDFYDGAKSFNLRAVYSDDENSENKSFATATPSAHLNIVVNDTTRAVDFFEKGKEYYLDFSPAEK